MAENFDEIKCPACQKVMTKVFVPSAGVNVDICLDGCGGIYFDNREFKKMDEEHEDIAPILDAIKGKEFATVDDNLPRTCPACGATMHKNFSSINREVKVDDCYTCGGKFLDNGELQKIREEFATEEERTAATMDLVYKTVGLEIKEMEEKAEELRAKRSPLKKLFDKLVYG